MDESPFSAMYRGRPPWDIGRAQPAFVELANAGLVTGRVLEPGCGTGENILEMADRGLEAWGFDIVPRAVKLAAGKALERGLASCVHLEVRDALRPGRLPAFDTVLDCGLFHTFSDPDRRRYERVLRRLLKPGGRLHLLCFSDWEDASWGGPRRVSQAEILATFGAGWVVDDIQPARILTTPDFQIRGHAWLATIERAATPALPRVKRTRRAQVRGGKPPKRRAKAPPKPQGRRVAAAPLAKRPAQRKPR